MLVHVSISAKLNVASIIFYGKCLIPIDVYHFCLFKIVFKFKLIFKKVRYIVPF